MQFTRFYYRIFTSIVLWSRDLAEKLHLPPLRNGFPEQ